MKSKIIPYNKREEKNMSKSFAHTKSGVKSVAKDTNATRRKDTIEPLKNKIKPKSFKRKATNEPKGIK